MEWEAQGRLRPAELSPEELELRKTGLGASEIAAIAGLNPWRSALDVWLTKTGKKREPETSKRKKRGQLGQWMEPVIASWYAAQFEGWQFTKPTTRVHPSLPWALATPDLIGTPYPDANVAVQRRCEIKLVGENLRDHWSHGIPGYVYCQVQWQGFVTGIELADVAVWTGLEESDQHVIGVSYDRAAADDLAEIARDFWERNVLRDIPPPVEPTEDWGEYLQKRYPKNVEPMLKKAPVEAKRLVAQFLKADAALKAAEISKQEAGNELKALIGAHDGMEGEGFRVTWKNDKRSRPDWKGIAESLGATPEIVESFPGVQVRRFLVKELSPR